MGMGMGRGKGGGGGLSEMQRMHGMHTMQMMGRAEVEADAKGVYLLRGGELTVYDHDLNKVSTTVVCEVTGDCSNCPVCRGMMQQRKCGVGCMMHEESEGGGPRGEMGGGSCSGCRALARSGRGATPPGKALVRAIASGSVSVMHAPAVLTVGEADLHVHVDGVEGKGDAGAAVSAFVYPVGSPDAGKVAAMERVDPGRFMGTMALGAAGAYDLAVRVKRPGHSDEVVYFALRVSG